MFCSCKCEKLLLIVGRFAFYFAAVNTVVCDMCLSTKNLNTGILNHLSSPFRFSMMITIKLKTCITMMPRWVMHAAVVLCLLLLCVFSWCFCVNTDILLIT